MSDKPKACPAKILAISQADQTRAELQHWINYAPIEETLSLAIKVRAMADSVRPDVKRIGELAFVAVADMFIERDRLSQEAPE